jgi:ABC-type bacteriocin/lantibiotic exporter with double-glycine peptidase domain
MPENDKTLFNSLRKAAKNYPVVFLLSIVVTATSFVSIEILRRTLNLVTEHESDRIINYIFIFIGVTVFGFIISMITDYICVLNITKDTKQNQRDLLAMILKRENLSDLKYSPDELTMILTQTLTSYIFKSHAIIKSIINAIITIAIAIFYMQRIDRAMIMVCIFPILFIPIIYKFIGSKIQKNTFDKEKESSRFYAFIKSIITNINVVLVLKIISNIERKVSEYIKRYKRILYKESIYSSFENNLNYIVTLTGLCLVLSIGAIQIYNKNLTVPDLFAFLFAFEYILTPIVFLTGLNVSLSECKGLYERVNEIIKAGKREYTADKITEINKINSIEFMNLEGSVGETTIKYPDGVFCFNSGCGLVTINGRNGSGKTTLLRMLMRFENEVKGAIKVNDVNINDIDIGYWRSLISYAPQVTVFHKEKLRDDILYFNDAQEDEKRINYLMEKLNVDIELTSRESNADNNVLSDGEKQKINLMRAFYKQGQILILDEPFVSLDTNTKTLLEKLIEEEKTKRIIFLISHENKINSGGEKRYTLDGDIKTEKAAVYD